MEVCQGGGDMSHLRCCVIDAIYIGVVGEGFKPFRDMSLWKMDCDVLRWKCCNMASLC